MGDTIFHKIIRREIPAELVYEDEHLIAFRDIAPQAPVHVLFVPKQTFATLNDVPEASALVIGRLATAAARYAKAQGFNQLYLYSACRDFYERFGWQYIGDALDYPDTTVHLYRYAFGASLGEITE